ncbi:MAG: phosphoribosyl-AMP cyclohydrolase [Candidatus Hadarchaeales archaeon]
MKLKEENAESIMGELDFKNGLITAVVRDHRSKEILMVAFQDREAVRMTLTTGLMHYWSRSRKKLWLKGEESGHHQKLKTLKVDCDGDAVLYDVEQIGASCHRGYFSCFYRGVKRGKLVTTAKKKFDPDEVYSKNKR